jgi:DNA polymerase IIIc chi subunit
MENALMLFDNDDDLKNADMKLWTYSTPSFLPHGSKFSIAVENASYCKVWLSTSIEFINNPTCLIHNGLSNINDTIRHFEKIIDIFDIQQMSFAKDRLFYYRSIGFSDAKLWIRKNNEWVLHENLSN